MAWNTFLRAHWGAIAATDFFTIELYNGFGAFGAFAVPQGVALDETKVSVSANTASTDEAGAAALDACQAVTGTACTLIGYLVPAGN